MEAGATVPVMLSLSVRALLCGVAAAALTGCTSGRGAHTPPNAPPARVELVDMKNTQNAQAQEMARLAGDVKAMDAQQAFLVAEIKNLSEQIAKLKSSLIEAEDAVRSLRAAPVPPESSPAPPFVPPAAASPPSRNAEADRIFASGLAKVLAGDGGQAALEFTEFVAKFPSHPQAAAAQNHIGEAYYRQRDYRQALGEFQKTVDGYTQAVQVSEALLKIGLCQSSLGDLARAKASWEQVVKQFPKSDAAQQARALLAAGPAGGR